MSTPVNLANLREMTDGDKDLEKELFAEFFISSEECIATLQSCCSNGENEAWRSSAHALKGTSYNLGATKLGDLCKKAQENNTANAQEKTTILNEIKSEYQEVRKFLESPPA